MSQGAQRGSTHRPRQEASTIINASALQDHRRRSIDLNLLLRIARKGIENEPAHDSSADRRRARDVWVCEMCTWKNTTDRTRSVCLPEFCSGCSCMRRKAAKGLTLAQTRGLVKAPPPKLSVDEWRACEQRASERGDQDHPCSICRDHLGAREHVILSCSHMFHLSCIRSFERFLRSSHRVCPLCRKQNYEKRRTTQATGAHRKKCATKIQALVRGHLARKRCYQLWLLFYRAGHGDRFRRRQFLAKRISKTTDQLLRQMDAKHNSVDSLLHELDLTLALSRKVFRSSAVGNQEDSCDESMPDSKRTWRAIFVKACERHDSECPICMCDFSMDMSDASLLSCTHVFHSECLGAFEGFNIYEVSLCPLCRSGYEARRWMDLQTPINE